MPWVTPSYDPVGVNAAGRALVEAEASSTHDWSDDAWDAYIKQIEVVNNWRSSHAYPLNTLQVNLRGVARRFDSDFIVAQRIKRLSSIASKLSRFPTMKLSQMQDLGGCRAILSTIGAAKEVVSYYRHQTRIKHHLASVDDYIESPKASGYRGAHFVYRYHSDKSLTPWNGLKVEIQVRSRYQHAWATAVETAGTFSGQALKSSLGSADWQRFFALVSSAIAMRERTAMVPGTPTTRSELLAELRSLTESLQVMPRLHDYSRALRQMKRHATAKREAGMFLLELDTRNASLQITPYSRSELDLATTRYAEVESRRDGQSALDAVLVTVESIKTLAKAYPNYFADTRLFLLLLDQFLRGRSRGINLPDRQLQLIDE